MVLHNGSSNIRSSVANIVDLFDRTSVASGTNSISVTAPAASSPIQMNLNVSGDTLLVDGTGVSVTKVPNSISSTNGIILSL